jgi:hypothetical protein
MTDHICDFCGDHYPNLAGALACENQHRTAMAVHTMMGAVTELIALANDGHGYELVKSNVDELEITHAQLARLLNVLRFPILQTQATSLTVMS